jgi:hypothetical protein
MRGTLNFLTKSSKVVSSIRKPCSYILLNKSSAPPTPALPDHIVGTVYLNASNLEPESRKNYQWGGNSRLRCQRAANQDSAQRGLFPEPTNLLSSNLCGKAEDLLTGVPGEDEPSALYMFAAEETAVSPS